MLLVSLSQRVPFKMKIPIESSFQLRRSGDVSTMVQSINTFVNSTKEKLHSKIIIKSKLHNTLIANLMNSYNISYL